MIWITFFRHGYEIFVLEGAVLKLVCFQK